MTRVGQLTVGLTIEIARFDVDGFALCKDLANFVEFPSVPGYEYYDPMTRIFLSGLCQG